MSPEPLRLSGAEPVASGNSRLCFVHPETRDLMVKVTRPDATPEIRRRQAKKLRHRLLPAWYMDEQRRELKAYDRLKARHGAAAWRHIPEFMGMVDTDIGPGLVSRFVRSADGTPAVNLTRFTRDLYTPDIADAVTALTDFVVDLRLLPRDFGPYNVVIAREDDGRVRAWLVDGFGSAEFLPLSEWSARHGTRMAHRRVEKFRYRLETRLDDPEPSPHPLTLDL